MSRRDAKLYLRDILDSITAIEEYTHGMNLEDLRTDRRTADAVTRNMEIIGEAAYNMPDEIKLENPTIPWRDMSDMRNKLIHEYSGIDLEVIWRTVKEDLPTLKVMVEGALATHNK